MQRFLIRADASLNVVKGIGAMQHRPSDLKGKSNPETY